MKTQNSSIEKNSDFVAQTCPYGHPVKRSRKSFMDLYFYCPKCVYKYDFESEKFYKGMYYGESLIEEINAK